MSLLEQSSELCNDSRNLEVSLFGPIAKTDDAAKGNYSTACQPDMLIFTLYWGGHLKMSYLGEGRGSIAQWLAYLLLTLLPWVFITLAPEFFFPKNINVAELLVSSSLLKVREWTVRKKLFTKSLLNWTLALRLLWWSSEVPLIEGEALKINV